MKNPHKAAEVLLFNGSIGDPDDDLESAFEILMAVAEASIGQPPNPRVIVRALVDSHGRETIAAMVRETAD